jgi:hypothetical protein
MSFETILNIFFGYIYYVMTVYDDYSQKIKTGVIHFVFVVLEFIMFCFSHIQLFLTKIYKNYHIFMKKQNLLKKKKNVITMEFIKDTILRTTISAFSDKNYDFDREKIPTDFDFCIITNNKQKRIERCLENIDDDITLEKLGVDYKLILCEITFLDTQAFVFELKTEQYNFMIEDNKIDAAFLKYFLTIYYSRNVENISMEKYILKIIDNNVTITELTPDDSVTIQKDGIVIQKF